MLGEPFNLPGRHEKRGSQHFVTTTALAFKLFAAHYESFIVISYYLNIHIEENCEKS